MKARHGICLIPIFCLAVGAYAAADTVMIYVQAVPAKDAGVLPEAVVKDGAALRSAVEEGIMDEFFDGGHIVFNEPPVKPAGGVQSQTVALEGESRNSAEIQKWYEVQQTAVRGGATRLVEVMFVYVPDETGKKAHPVNARYSLWELKPRGLLRTGAVDATTLTDRSVEGVDYVGKLMGQTIAIDLFNAW
ncbi:MAG TPA: hypothetical protein VMW87_05070 [Spirochaetia bacterium]|nr:hypothetical protein [Spirochaetia bacterium]